MKLRALLLVVTAASSLASCKDKKPALASAKLPAECADYKTAIDKLAACDALPLPTRQALTEAYQAAAAKWASAPAEGKLTLASTCQEGAAAINKMLTSCK